jgi:hypothetical protein
MSDKKTLALMLKKMSRVTAMFFCFDFSRVVPETAKSGIFKNQNNMSSRAVFFQLSAGWPLRAV